jgi:hypothetical protein
MKRIPAILAGLVAACLLGALLLNGQAEPRPQMAEDVFKNIQVLKGVPVDQFMNTMGIFSAALGMSCEDCHASNDSTWSNYALDTSPRKRMARTMVGMMAGINRTYFGGRQMVTCFTCHRAGNRPLVTPNLATLYDRPFESEDVIEQATTGPTADQILDRYVQAMGGSLTSFVARGTSRGYGPENEPRPLEIYSRAPTQRTTIIHTLNGDNTSVYDGRAGWIAQPLRPVAVLALTGHALEGARLDAQLTFPAQIKQALGQRRAGFPTTINDRDMQVVQGTTPGGMLATLYFDAESGLLVRQVRYAESPVGRMPTQVDYADYRDVAGVKMPFRWTLTWLDGKETVELTDVQANAAVEPSRFARPVPPSAR